MKLYDIVLADPPWSFSPRRNPKTKIKPLPYQAMSFQDIKELDISSIMKPNSLLYCWVVLSQLDRCIDAIKTKELTLVSTGFVWVKLTKQSSPTLQPNKFINYHDNFYGVKFGIGNYTASNAEICLIFRKGKMLRYEQKVSQIILAPLTKHSQKPHESIELLDTMYPSSKFDKIELFSRSSKSGWDSTGDQSHNPQDIKEFLSLYS